MLGQALELAGGAPWDVMTRWAREYGKIYQFPLFGHVNVVVSDPAYMREVMRSKVRGKPVLGFARVDFEVHPEACTALLVRVFASPRGRVICRHSHKSPQVCARCRYIAKTYEARWARRV